MNKLARSQQVSSLTSSSWACFVIAVLLTGILPACKEGGRSGNSVGTSLAPPAEPDPPGDVPGFPLIDHVDQALITSGTIGFDELFLLGDELFEAEFNALDGVGIALLPDGTPLPSRFSRVPPGHGRFTGPNAQSCEACHNIPFGTAAGATASNVVQDPAGAGIPPFNTRNPPSLFGSAVLQRLAEEITEDLLAIRAATVAAATPGGSTVTSRLLSKGVDYGTISARRAADGSLTLDVANVRGVDVDLVVRPYGWKGNTTTLRDFTRGAAINELGLEPDELTSKSSGLDPDGDGVEGELSVGDVTALSIYIGAQEIPTTTSALVGLGFESPVSAKQAAAIERGEQLFASFGCASCHIPELRLFDTLFEEPTRRGGGNFFDQEIDADATHLTPEAPFRFDLVRQGDFPRLEPHPGGGARARLFGDLKRHNMGEQLADAQPTAVVAADGRPLRINGSAVVVAASTFLTAELWGVGDTGPWLHDGRAATLDEAVMLHGVDTPPAVGDPRRSEAQEARSAFAAASEADRAALVSFLLSLRHFSLGGADEE